MQKIIEITNGVARHPLYRMRKPIDFTLEENEHIAIVGPNGAGKSILTDTILGKYPLLMNDVKYDFSPSDSKMAYENIKYIAFRDTYGDADNNYYYQQRWHSQDADTTPLVRELLPEVKDSTLRDELYALLGIESLLDKRLILLSSGELRKFQLTRTLLGNPRVLIMDNPFIGLDAQTRELLHQLLNSLTSLRRLQVILILSKTDDIPAFITHVVPVQDMTCGQKITKANYLAHQEELPAHVLEDKKREAILRLPVREDTFHAEQVVNLHRVSIRYGERTILKDLDWGVKRGEHWAVSGENGAGKSTLLSLICADNPQSYACDIALFGRKRGSGESIWEIKKHIGYVSPEMHRAYLKNLPTIDIVASGLRDSIGLYHHPNAEEAETCALWLDIFGILSLRDRNFLQLSSGEQRLVLLARAFVKDPDLLVLDEPMHGLDLRNRKLAQEVIETFCQRQEKTLILVTHYAEELPAVIDHRLFLHRHH